ncbi:MAG: hypothetical protein K8W52_43910 [Deltaproteobacteria bacterium]|nr:hypothetical protein [Deltaproteobacteria bacterium]
MRPGVLAPIVALALTACDGRVYHNLVGPASDDLRVAITVTPNDDGSADVVAELGLADPSACLVLGTPFTGDLNGRHPDRVRRGAVEADGTCTWPQLGFTVPAVDRVDAAQVHVNDITFGFTAELGDRLVPRATALEAPADAIVRPGEHLRATWSSATDRASGAFMISLVAAGVNVADLPATVDGDHVVADVPATFVADGTGLLCVAWSSAWAPDDVALGCNELACRLVADYRECVPVWFAART